MWTLRSVTDSEGRARVAIVNAQSGNVVDLYWPELRAVAERVCAAYNSTLLLARQIEREWKLAFAA